MNNIKRLIKNYSAYDDETYKILMEKGIRFFKCVNCGLKYPIERCDKKDITICDNCGEVLK